MLERPGPNSPFCFFMTVILQEPQGTPVQSLLVKLSIDLTYLDIFDFVHSCIGLKADLNFLKITQKFFCVPLDKVCENYKC